MVHILLILIPCKIVDKLSINIKNISDAEILPHDFNVLMLWKMYVGIRFVIKKKKRYLYNILYYYVSVILWFNYCNL